MEKIGIIGGSGIYDIEGVELLKEHDMETPFGRPSAPVRELSFQGRNFFFIPRHGVGHTLLPSEVPYDANIYALKLLGVKTLLSISAVGSLREDLAPGSLFLPDQFVDWTRGQRPRTFFGKGMAGHVSAAYAVHEPLRQKLAKACERADVPFAGKGSYVCIEGPLFSTRAESEFYRGSLKASIIGMTNVPEAFLAKEANMAYATLALVTDYDCWKEEPCSVEEILKTLKKNFVSAQKVIKELLPDLFESPLTIESANEYAVMTNPEKLSKQNQEIVEVLQR